MKVIIRNMLLSLFAFVAVIAYTPYESFAKIEQDFTATELETIRKANCLYSGIKMLEAESKDFTRNEFLGIVAGYCHSFDRGFETFELPSCFDEDYQEYLSLFKDEPKPTTMFVLGLCTIDDEV